MSEYTQLPLQCKGKRSEQVLYQEKLREAGENYLFCLLFICKHGTVISLQTCHDGEKEQGTGFRKSTQDSSTHKASLCFVEFLVSNWEAINSFLEKL